MAELIRMPKMSDTMEEGVIAAWHVKVGDEVKSGDILAEVETDKATMDMESYEDGTVLYIGVEKGAAIPVDAPMLVLGKPGENYDSLLADEKPADKPVAETAAAPLAAAAPAKTIDTSNINAVLVKMPLLSDTMTEGVIHKWHYKVGDVVKAGEVLAEIETDKATMDFESYDDGVLLYRGVEEGAAAPVNAVIAIVGEKGADYQTLLDADAAASVAAPVKEAKPEPAKAAAPAAKPAATAPAKKAADPVNSNGRVLASPLAKRLAEEKGINIADVAGSGEGGRIIKLDVDNFVPAAAVASSSALQQESFEEIPLSQMRKAIAKGLAQSKSTAPEFSLTIELCMDKVIPARVSMNEYSPVKITFNDMILKACGVALTKHPAVNSSWRGDHIRRNNHVNIGMAVAVEDGLLVPVIRYANTLTMSEIAAETKNLGGKAKNKELQPKDWEGNTFTVSNLGAFGIDEFTSIINNPANESCILSVGNIKDVVAVDKNGGFYATKIMKVTLTCDHRVVDGATGAAFLVTLKELIEEPYKLLV